MLAVVARHAGARVATAAVVNTRSAILTRHTGAVIDGYWKRQLGVYVRLGMCMHGAISKRNDSVVIIYSTAIRNTGVYILYMQCTCIYMSLYRHITEDTR